MLHIQSFVLNWLCKSWYPKKRIIYPLLASLPILDLLFIYPLVFTLLKQFRFDFFLIVSRRWEEGIGWMDNIRRGWIGKGGRHWYRSEVWWTMVVFPLIDAIAISLKILYWSDTIARKYFRKLLMWKTTTLFLILCVSPIQIRNGKQEIGYCNPHFIYSIMESSHL